MKEKNQHLIPAARAIIFLISKRKNVFVIKTRCGGLLNQDKTYPSLGMMYRKKLTSVVPCTQRLIHQAQRKH